MVACYGEECHSSQKKGHQKYLALDQQIGEELALSSSGINKETQTSIRGAEGEGKKESPPIAEKHPITVLDNVQIDYEDPTISGWNGGSTTIADRDFEIS